MTENDIFVFGSNTQGRHSKGAAKDALMHHDAKYGQAKGRQGFSYAIVTKDLTKDVHPSVSLESIKEQIKKQPIASPLPGYFSPFYTMIMHRS